MPRLIRVLTGRTVILLVLSWGGSIVIVHPSTFCFWGGHLLNLGFPLVLFHLMPCYRNCLCSRCVWCLKPDVKIGLYWFLTIAFSSTSHVTCIWYTTRVSVESSRWQYTDWLVSATCTITECQCSATFSMPDWSILNTINLATTSKVVNTWWNLNFVSSQCVNLLLCKNWSPSQNF